MSKHSSRRVRLEINDQVIRFDSAVERDRYLYLKDKEERGVICELMLQPSFILLEKFQRGDNQYRSVKFTADFSYYINGGNIIEEVITSVKPREENLKTKFFLYFNPELTFYEVKKIRKSWEINEL